MIGYKYFLEKGVYWRTNQGGIFVLSPPSLVQDFSVSDARSLLKTHNAYFVRWEKDYDSERETGWWYVVKDEKDDINSLPKKTRYYIKKASKTLYAKKINRNDILSYGYGVYCRAYERYTTHEEKLTQEGFEYAIKALPVNTEFWGVYSLEDSRLVAFSENFIHANECFFVTMWFDEYALSNSASYLLFYEMQKYYFENTEVRCLSNGTRPLSHNTNIQEFLISKFRYRKAYSSLCIEYKPLLAFFVSIVFPFRNIISTIPFVPFSKLKILLQQEEMRIRSNFHLNE